MGLNRNFREGDYVKVVKSWEYDVENGIPLYPPNSDVMDFVLGGEIGRALIKNAHLNIVE